MIRRNFTLDVLYFVLVLCLVESGLARLAPARGNSRPVELIWGIEEVQTPLGKLFNFTIPKDAFAGEIADIKVTEAGQSALPVWLTFEPATRQFLGLPVLAKDLGAHYIAVTVFGSKPGQSVEDVFTLLVKEGDAKPECVSEAAQTVLTLLLDVEWSDLDMFDKTSLLTKFSSYMDIPVGDFKISPVLAAGTAALFDASALMAGPGNVKEVKFPGGGVKLSSVVGCDGNVNGNRNKELAKFVEEASKDGSMARFTGVDVLGWTVTTRKPVPSQRQKRQGNFLNTPEPSPILPTVAVGGLVRPTAVVGGLVRPTAVVGGEANDRLHPVIRPTAVLEQGGGVRPTATVDGSNVLDASGSMSPDLRIEHYPVTPTPPLPPPPPSGRTRPSEDGMGPKVGKPIGGGLPVVAVGGHEFRYQIPKDAFVTEADAETKVSLLEQMEKDTWLKLENNEGAYVLHGLPMADAKGPREYHLDVNANGKTIQLPFKIEVQVADDNVTHYNHESEVVLNEAFEEFGVDRRLKFVDTLRSYFGDADARHVVVRSIKSGSTVVAWTNDTYRGVQCGDADFAAVGARLVQPDGTVNPEFQEFASSLHGFKVDKVMVRKIGPCAASALTEPAGNDVYLSMIVPIVVVSSLLLIACCIGCLLYRKKRRGKMTPEPDQIFVGKNKPVIFKGENNEPSNNGAKGNNGPSKKPAVLADERPAVPPPHYPGRSPTPDMRGIPSHLAQHDDIDQDPQLEQQVPLLHLPVGGNSDRDARHPPHLQLVTPSSRK